LWIRIDSNYIDVDKLLHLLKKKEIEICTCDLRGCTVDNCKAVKGRNVPPFHLPRLQDQKTARQKTDGGTGNSYLHVPANANEFSDKKSNWDSSASERDCEMIKSPSGKGGKDNGKGQLWVQKNGNDGDEQTATPTSDQARSDARSPSGEGQDGNSKEKRKKKQKESNNNDWWEEDWWGEDWWEEKDDWWEDNSWNQSPQRKKKEESKNTKSREKESSNWWDSSNWWKESYRDDDWNEDRPKKIEEEKNNNEKGKNSNNNNNKGRSDGKGRQDENNNNNRDNNKGEKRDEKGKGRYNDEKGKDNEKGKEKGKGKNGKDEKGFMKGDNKGKGKDDKGRYDDKGKGFKGKDEKGKGKGKDGKGKNGWESFMNMIENDKDNKKKKDNGWNSWNGWNNNWYDISKEVERVTSYYMQGLASRMPSPLPIPPGLDIDVPFARPFYVFIDAEAILKMAFPSDRCLFSFEQLAFLCSNQIMSHQPRYDSGLPIMQSVQDNERILFIFTDLAMQMLFELAKSTDEDSLANKMLSLQFTETSYLPLGFARGFIEMVESKHHNSIVVLSEDERLYGKKLNLSDDHICHIDFIFYWDRLLRGDTSDRTILVSGNKKVVQFFDQCLDKRSVRCFSIDELQTNTPKELSPFSSVSCWEQVEDLIANKKCLTADILSKSLESMRVGKV